MSLTEPFDTLFEKYYGHIYLYIKWYTEDPTLHSEILEKTFAQYILISGGIYLLPASRLLRIAREVAIALTKGIRPSLEELQRRTLIFTFLDPISDEDRDIYFERFYRNASDEEVSIKYGIPVYAVQEKIRRIAMVHGRNLKLPTQESNIRNG